MATSNTKPAALPMPFADGGDKNSIPSADIGTNAASWNLGFPPLTEKPYEEDGLPPDRKDFNAMYNYLSAYIVWLQNGGTFGYDAVVSAQIGGYSEGAVLTLTNGQKVRSSINNNTNNPNSDMTGWVNINSTSDEDVIANYRTATITISDTGTFGGLAGTLASIILNDREVVFRLTSASTGTAVVYDNSIVAASGTATNKNTGATSAATVSYGASADQTLARALQSLANASISALVGAQSSVLKETSDIPQSFTAGELVIVREV